MLQDLGLAGRGCSFPGLLGVSQPVATRLSCRRLNRNRLDTRAGSANRTNGSASIVPVFAVGVSLGGNALLKWLGEQGKQACQAG